MTVRTRRRTGRLNLERTSWKKRATAVQYYALRHTGTWGRGGGVDTGNGGGSGGGDAHDGLPADFRAGRRGSRSVG